MAKVSVLCLFFALSLSLVFAGAENYHPYSNEDLTLAKGLSWKFYEDTCPQLESIVKKRIKFHLNKDITQAAGLLRLHFHDCFVQGCDASVLLDGSASRPSEQDAPPNLTLRQKAFEIINDIKEHVDKACDVVVSCADITALAARDSVAETGGPKYKVPLGRRDSLEFASEEVTDENIPQPTFDASALIDAFAVKGLDVIDLVALSGGHTIGRAHCASFDERLYPTQDSTLAKSFAKSLKVTCPSTNITNTTVLDIRSPKVFDNKYYVNLKNREGLFTSDQDLYTDSRTKQIVEDFALDQDLFFQKFALGMAKMGQLSVLTGSKGEIRDRCYARNPTPSITTMVEDDADSAEL